MGCRVNGPGETDHADLGLWCGPTTVNLKRGSTRLGAFSYAEILPRLQEELDRLVKNKADGGRRMATVGQVRMSKAKCRKNDEWRIPKAFVLRALDFVRHLNFDIRHSFLFPSAVRHPPCFCC